MDGTFKCKNASLVITFPDGRPTTKTFDVRCGDTGDFENLAEWPTCLWPSCSFDMLPIENATGELRPVIGENATETPQDDFMKYACPGDNVTDSGIYVSVPCVANIDETGMLLFL